MGKECKERDIRINKKGNWIDLSELPRWRFGEGQPNGVIHWSECAKQRKKVNFKYEDIEDSIEIIGYDKKILTVNYKGLHTKIDTGSFLLGYIGTSLGVRTGNFKLEIGTNLKDDKRDITITDREYRIKHQGKYKHKEKWYKYTCNKCGWTEGWVIEGALMSQNVGCSCCSNSNKKVVAGINDLATTHPWVRMYLKDKNDMHKYSYGSDKRIKVICPDCHREKTVFVSDLVRNHSMGCPCSDKMSYPEKFFFNLLTQLDVKYKFQLNKNSQGFNWCENKRYDFYIQSINAIIETNGIQHYRDSSNWGDLDTQINNDNYKKELALKNGIKHYIQLDCRYSDLSYIKNSILNSEINKLFDLSKIDWLKCHEFACSNLIKIACEYKNKNKNITTSEIGRIMNLTKTTIRKYLKQGTILKWCEYNPKEESNRINILNSKKVGKKQEKKVAIYKNDIKINVFNSITELSNKSEELFNVKLSVSKISMVCRGKKPQYKGFTFKFVDDEDSLEKIS